MGFGIVRGKYRKRALKRIRIPEGSNFGSLRTLSSFIDLTGKRLPASIPFKEAVRQISAMAKLHPKSDKAHKRICAWMDRQLPRTESRVSTDSDSSLESHEVKKATPAKNPQMDYYVRKKAEIIKAKKTEACLVEDYRKWLERKGRKLSALTYRRLQCDVFEERSKNLIEAKSSTRREHIRMAAGQILDYAYQVRKKYRNTNMALLLPEKPGEELVNWLRPLKISLIWRERHGKLTFSDNANGQFA